VYDNVITICRPTLILAALSQFGGLAPREKGNEFSRQPLEIVEYSCPMPDDRAAELSASATVVDRQLFLKVGGWTPDIFHGNNKDLLMKLGYSGSLGLILSPKTVFCRVHTANSIHNVLAFLGSAHRLIRNERSGIYPGGQRGCSKDTRL